MSRFFFLEREKQNWQNAGIQTGSPWPFWLQLSVAKQALLCDVLWPWYWMFIKRGCRYKQEDAIVLSRNTGGSQTMDRGSFLHSGTGTGACTWLQSENWWDYCLIYPATLWRTALIVVHYCSDQHKAEERLSGFAWIFSCLLSERFLSSNSLSLLLSLSLSHVSRNWLKL